MIGTPTEGFGGNKKAMIAGTLLLASALAMNYLFEHHNVLIVWENSPYSVGWSDLFYPVLCVFLSLTGIALVFNGAIRHRAANRRLLWHTLAIAAPLTVLYGLFAFAMQALQTGADRLGECSGLNQAASSSNVIPEATWRPGHPAVACGVERRGIFLTYYNQVWVYGVTNAATQQCVLDKVAEHHKQAHTHPVQVMFYEGVEWFVRQGRSGSISSGSPRKLVRVVNIG